MPTKKFFYRWVILLACFFIMAVPFSLVNTIHTLFITPVTTALGFSISAFSVIFTISAIVAAVMSPVIGKMINSVSLRIVMTTGAVLVGGGFIAYSFASSIVVFYLIGAVVSVGMAALTTIPISTMVTNWFQNERCMALGIAFAGGGLGTFFWMQIISKVLDQYGYQQAYLLLGIIILAIGLPITLFIVYLSPDKKYGLKRSSEISSASTAEQDKMIILKNPLFWPFSIGLLIMGFVIAGVQIHLQSYLSSLQYPLAYSANIGSVSAMAALVGNIVGGIIFDKFSVKHALYFFAGCTVLALAALLVAEFPKLPYIYAILFGVSLCMPGLWPSYGVGKIFPQENYAVTLGIVNLFFVIGAALGPFFSGIMADTSFGYKTAWFLYIFLTVIYSTLFIKCLKK